MKSGTKSFLGLFTLGVANALFSDQIKTVNAFATYRLKLSKETEDVLHKMDLQDLVTKIPCSDHPDSDDFVY